MRWLSIIYFKQEVEDLNPFVNIFFSQFSGGGGGGGGHVALTNGGGGRRDIFLIN